MTPQQRAAVDAWLAQLKPAASGARRRHRARRRRRDVGIAVDTVDVMRTEQSRELSISFYAAGIGVMFLLFSMSGASGALLEEVESGTLDRVALHARRHDAVCSPESGCS